ncbi:MAG TPA: cytochrome C oxidase subunit IV family protein [Pseudonocardia sp.]|jgi:heme/copper-type cytochrome/quinol oxidase subunit 4|nr:cytochrome C oxidase subunit IV family protein [Pseudonocardia sp.]
MSDTAVRVAPRSFPKAPLIVWVGLIIATLLSYWLGSDHGLSSAEARTLIIFVVAFVKVRFVGLYFMELRQAPVILRSLFEGWCVVVCLLLAGLYLWA